MKFSSRKKRKKTIRLRILKY